MKSSQCWTLLPRSVVEEDGFAVEQLIWHGCL